MLSSPLEPRTLSLSKSGFLLAFAHKHITFLDSSDTNTSTIYEFADLSISNATRIDLNTLIVALYNGTILVYDMDTTTTTTKLRYSMTFHTSTILSLSPSYSKHLFYATSSQGQYITCNYLTTGKYLLKKSLASLGYDSIIQLEYIESINVVLIIGKIGALYLLRVYDWTISTVIAALDTYKQSTYSLIAFQITEYFNQPCLLAYFK